MNGVDLLTSIPGFRDYFPEDWREIEFILTKMREISKKYGYEEYEGPTMEKVELIEAKSGEGIMEEIFQLADSDDRRLLLRPEQTPTLARMLAKEQQRYKRPIRWFSIPRLFRDETVQKGREREFWQLNVDILGEDALTADAETLAVAIDIIRACGIKDNQFKVYINHRGLLNNFIESICDVSPQVVIPIIDKKMAFLQEYAAKLLSDNGMNKQDAHEGSLLFRRIINSSGQFEKELIKEAPDKVLELVDKEDELTKKVMEDAYKDLGLTEAQATDLYSLTCINGSPEEFLEKIDNINIPASCNNPIDDLSKLSVYLKALDVIDPIVYDASMARGLDYYTGIVYEAFDTTGQIVRAIFGGGRYADLVQAMGGTELSGVGFGMGELVLLELVKLRNALPDQLRDTPDIYMAPIKEKPIPKLLELATRLRKNYKVLCNPFPWRLGRHFEAADDFNAEIVLLLGQRDINNGVISVRKVESGEQTEIPLEGDMELEISKLLNQEFPS